MTGPLIELLAKGRRARLKLAAGPDGTLHVTGPPSAGPLVRALLTRKHDALQAIRVYTGTSTALDWRDATTLQPPQPCTRCRRACLLLDPWDNQPWHKVCAEHLIRPRRKPAA